MHTHAKLCQSRGEQTAFVMLGTKLLTLKQTISRALRESNQAAALGGAYKHHLGAAQGWASAWGCIAGRRSSGGSAVLPSTRPATACFGCPAASAPAKPCCRSREGTSAGEADWN